MRLHPLGSAVQQVHLLLLGLSLSLHALELFVAFAFLLDALFVLICDLRQLIMNFIKLPLHLVFIPTMVLHILIILLKLLVIASLCLIEIGSELAFFFLIAFANIFELGIEIHNGLL